MKEKPDLVVGWLKKAASDLVAMRASAQAGALDAGCFHAQQAAEKYLKAYLAQSQHEILHTHNLYKLVNLCAESDSSFRELIDAAELLTPFAVIVRYDTEFWPVSETVEQADHAANRIAEFVSARVQWIAWKAYDEQARVARLTPEQRLHLHRQNSKPVMDKLEAWLKAQFVERLVEPNSGLGKAISYLLNHWARLTLFLEKAGAPLDHNLAERCLKKAILHRKNSLFYKTRNGAQMGDLYMSLIHTCELNGANPFDYLTELQRHAEQVEQAPAEWMPWNYRERLAPAVNDIDSG